jgi:hypothetical protein
LNDSYYYVFSWNFRYIIGGPFAIVGSFYPEVALSNGEEVSTIAGLVVQIKPPRILQKQKHVQMIAVDVLVANLWMGFYFMELKNQIKLTNG